MSVDVAPVHLAYGLTLWKCHLTMFYNNNKHSPVTLLGSSCSYQVVNSVGIEILLLFFGLQPFCPFWPLTPEINNHHHHTIAAHCIFSLFWDQRWLWPYTSSSAAVCKTTKTCIYICIATRRRWVRRLRRSKTSIKHDFRFKAAGKCSFMSRPRTEMSERISITFSGWQKPRLSVSGCKEMAFNSDPFRGYFILDNQLCKVVQVKR